MTTNQVLKAIYESGLHQYAPQVLRTVWKDGIDINEPSHALMNFVGKLLPTLEAMQAENAALRTDNAQLQYALEQSEGYLSDIQAAAGGMTQTAIER